MSDNKSRESIISDDEKNSNSVRTEKFEGSSSILDQFLFTRSTRAKAPDWHEMSTTLIELCRTLETKLKRVECANQQANQRIEKLENENQQLRQQVQSNQTILEQTLETQSDTTGMLLQQDQELILELNKE